MLRSEDIAPRLLHLIHAGLAAEARSILRVQPVDTEFPMLDLVTDAQAMRFLLRGHHVSPRYEDAVGDGLLHLCVRFRGSSDVIATMIAHGVDPNMRAFDGTTPLHEAASAGRRQDRIRNVEALLNAGANPNVADLRGQTPLHVAAMRGIPELVAILVHRGALLYKDFKGRTPLDIARHKGLSGSALDLLTKLKRGVGDLATAALESLQKAIVTAQGVEDGQIEGLRRSTLLSVIERNPKNRAAAIQAHGDKCMVCGFHFESVYGSLGRGYIEVHHCTPLSSLSRGRKINPKREMAVLCANCHRMIHRRVTPILSVAELKRQLT